MSNNTELKSLRFKKNAALGNSTELKSLRFKKLGKENKTELKSLKFKKNLGKSLPVNVMSSRILNSGSNFSLTKLGVSPESEALADKISTVLAIIFIVFILFKLKNRMK